MTPIALHLIVVHTPIHILGVLSDEEAAELVRRVRLLLARLHPDVPDHEGSVLPDRTSTDCSRTSRPGGHSSLRAQGLSVLCPFAAAVATPRAPLGFG